MSEQKTNADRRNSWERNRDAAIGNLGKMVENPLLPKEIREKLTTFIQYLALIRRALPQQESKGKPPASS